MIYTETLHADSHFYPLRLLSATLNVLVDPDLVDVAHIALKISA